MKDSNSVKRLADFFDFILTFAEDGLNILLGTIAAPTTEEIYNMIMPQTEDLGVHVDGGGKIPLAERRLTAIEPVEEIIALVGGWGPIWEAVREYKDKFPVQWQLIESFALFIRPGGIIRDGSGGMTTVISGYNDNVVPETLRKRRKKYLYTLAVYVMASTYSDGWNLSYYPTGRQARYGKLY
mgnify:CR=1 FL=1